MNCAEVGKDVLYVHKGYEKPDPNDPPRVSTAKITKIYEQKSPTDPLCVDLTVTFSGGIVFRLNVPLDSNKSRGSWHFA